MSVLDRLLGAKPKQGTHGRGTAGTASGVCDVDLAERQAETDAEEEQERRIPDIMADIEQAFPVGDTRMDDEARNEFMV